MHELSAKYLFYESIDIASRMITLRLPHYAGFLFHRLEHFLKYLLYTDVSCVCEFADVNQPYVVVEMDEPAQKYTTTKGLNMSPYWEESFEL